jgi:hypothetical protein
MMWSLVLSTLIALLKGKVGAALAEFLSSSVRIVADLDLSGAEKKAKLLEAADAIGGVVSEQLKAASGTLVNLLIEALVAKLGGKS